MAMAVDVTQVVKGEGVPDPGSSRRGGWKPGMEESDSEAFSGVNLVSVTMAMSDLLRATACWKAPNFDSSPKAFVSRSFITGYVLAQLVFIGVCVTESLQLRQPLPHCPYRLCCPRCRRQLHQMSCHPAAVCGVARLERKAVVARSSQQ
eukprot:scpid67328/ scgid5033/ 